MGDRGTAAIFSRIFDLLSEDPTEDRHALAGRVWKMMGDYDFEPCEIDCDHADLAALGLYRQEIDPTHSGETQSVYGPARQKSSGCSRQRKSR